MPDPGESPTRTRFGTVIALIDSGLGLLPTAALLRRARPEADLLLANDPAGAPWGPKPAGWVRGRVLDLVQESLDRGARGIVLPCNTASVIALQQVRERVGDGVPVVGTVPAIKPAAARCRRFAVWATAATTASEYQANLIRTFAADREVTAVACHGLAEAIDHDDAERIELALAEAVRATPDDVEGVVLGCTHYPLVADRIRALLPGVEIFDSSAAVVAQTLRRIPADGGGGRTEVVTHGGVAPTADLLKRLAGTTAIGG